LVETRPASEPSSPNRQSVGAHVGTRAGSVRFGVRPFRVVANGSAESGWSTLWGRTGPLSGVTTVSLIRLMDFPEIRVFVVCDYIVLFVCFLGCAFVGRDVVFVVWVVCDLVGWLSWEIGEAQGFSWYVSRFSAPAQCFFAPTQKTMSQKTMTQKTSAQQSMFRDTCSPVRCEGGTKGKNPAPLFSMPTPTQTK
jgi:hypothetical protein